MDIKARIVPVIVVDEVKLTASEWDSRGHGTITWRDHMASLLNLRAKKLAPQCDSVAFYCNLARFCQELGFGEFDSVVQVTERIYSVKLDFNESEQAAA